MVPFAAPLLSGLSRPARAAAHSSAPGGEDEVDRHTVVEAVEAGQQPLRIVGAVVAERVSGLDETVSLFVDDIAILWPRERLGRSYPRVSSRSKGKWSRKGKVAASN